MTAFRILSVAERRSLVAPDSSAQTAINYINERIVKEDRGHSSPCWIWQRYTNHGGYGRGAVPGFGIVRIHRASYELHIGSIPEGLHLDHLCRVPACCNPDHLEPVTPQENWRRAKPNRPPLAPDAPIRRWMFTRKTHCAKGHEFTPESSYVDPKGKRGCLICKKARRAAWYIKNRDIELTRAKDWRLAHPERLREYWSRARSVESVSHGGSL